MKKISVFFFIASFVMSPVWAAEETAKIMKVSGDVKVVRGNGTFDAQAGALMYSGDRVVTKESGSLDVTFNELAGSRVLGSSECVITETSVGSTRLDLKSGNMIFNLEKLPRQSTFTVETPTAIASVRGTQFWGRVNEDALKKPATTFAVREGSVQVTAKAAGQTFLLIKGQALDIPDDAAKSPSIREAVKEEMDAMSQASSIKTNTNKI